MNNFRLYAGITLIACAGLLSRLSGQTSPADLAWTQLSSSTVLPTGSTGIPDWQAIAHQADDFARNYPQDNRAKTAQQLSLSARIHGQENGPTLTPDLVTAVKAYLADTSNNVRDRVKLRIDFGMIAVKSAAHQGMSPLQSAKIAFAHDLIREFPAEPEGYGLLLSYSKTSDPATAHTLAKELLASPAPDLFKDGARRVIKHFDRLNQPLGSLDATPPLPLDQHKPVVIYSWTMANKGFLAIVRQYATTTNVLFVGINLDKDVAAAKAMASTLPGVQYFDGAGLDGPLARQLHLIFPTSLYLVDSQGIVRDVNGQHNPVTFFTGIAGTGGAQ